MVAVPVARDRMSVTQETRREGLDYIEPKTSDIARAVYSYLLTRREGATANEIQAANTWISLNSVRSRLTELQNKNLVEATRKKVNPSTGVRVAVWNVTRGEDLPLCPI